MDTLNPQPIQYRGYTIEPFAAPYSSRIQYQYFNTSEGPDFEWTGDAWKGNVGTADSLEEAKDEIEERIMKAKPMHIVKTDFGMREYPFHWLDEARRFASFWNADLLPYGQPILNP